MSFIYLLKKLIFSRIWLELNPLEQRNSIASSCVALPKRFSHPSNHLPILALFTWVPNWRLNDFSKKLYGSNNMNTTITNAFVDCDNTWNISYDRSSVGWRCTFQKLERWWCSDVKANVIVSPGPHDAAEGQVAEYLCDGLRRVLRATRHLPTRPRTPVPLD